MARLFLAALAALVPALGAAGAPQVVTAREPRGDFLLEGTGNALAAAVYGPGPVTLAGAGLVSLRGDKAAAQAFTDLFSLRPQTRSSSASPEDSAQVPGLSST